MSALITLILSLLQALVPAIVERAQDTAEDGDRAADLGAKLRAQIKAAWSPSGTILLLLMLTGCFTRTIYVPDGTPVRLRETVKGARVWVLDKDGTPVEGKLDIPEGWYALPIKDDTK